MLRLLKILQKTFKDRCTEADKNVSKEMEFLFKKQRVIR